MDGANQLANMLPPQGQGQGQGQGDTGSFGDANQYGYNNPQTQVQGNPMPGFNNNMFAPPHGNSNMNHNGNGFGPNGLPGLMDNTNALNNMNAMGGLGSFNATSPNDLDAAMNAVLMNNALQQNLGGGGGVMNPLLLQTMMSQGMLGAGGANPNPFAPAGNTAAPPATGMNMNGMGGCVGNFLAQPQGVMSNLGGATQNGMHNQGNAAASGMGANSAPAPELCNSAELYAQLLRTPMSAQLMAQGVNPMMFLGGGMGAPNPFSGGGGAGFNPLGALALPSAGLAAAMPPGLGGGMAGPPPVAAHGLPHMAPGGDGMLRNPLTGAAAAKGAKKGKKARKKDRPKRPLSAYNFFFREERSRILAALSKTEGGKKKTAEEEKNGNDKEETTKQQKDWEDEKETVEEDKGREEDNRAVKSESTDGDNTNKKEDLHTVVKKEPREDVVKKETGGNKNPEKGEGADKVTTNKDKGASAGAAGKDFDREDGDGKKIPHGKISFESLAKLIGQRWKELGAGEGAQYKRLAEQDMARYKEDMDTFLVKEAGGAIPGAKKRPGEGGCDGQEVPDKRMALDQEIDPETIMVP